jgi:hypothetical protein
MNLVKFMPLLGITGGVVVVIAGFNTGNTVLVIVGFILIGSGLFRQIRK